MAIELATISGWHDGQDINIAEPMNLHVIRHEDIHADILLNTPDGQLLNFCAMIASRTEDKGNRTRCNRLIAEHISNARTAHECAATFIGANVFYDTDERRKAREELSGVYQSYYSTMDDIVSGIASSILLKVAVAFAVTYAVFSSRSLMQWSQMRFDYEALRLDPPDRRFEAFRIWWFDNGLYQAKEFVRESGSRQPDFGDLVAQTSNDNKPFGALDDEDLLLNNITLARAVEAWLIEGLHAVFTSHAPLSFLSNDDWYASLQRLRKFARRVSLFIDIYRDTTGSPVRTSLESVHRAIATANTKLHIVPSLGIPTPSETPKVKCEDFSELLGDRSRVVGVIFNRDEPLSDLCALDVWSTGPYAGATPSSITFEMSRWIEPADALQGIKRHLAKIRSREQQMTRGSIVIPRYGPNDKNCVGPLHRALFGHSTAELGDERNEEVPVLSGNGCEYLAGGVYDFIDAHYKRYEFGFRYFRTDHQLTLMAVWGGSRTRWPHVVLKCLPVGAGDALFAHCLKRGDITLTEATPPRSVMAALRLLTSYWSVL